MNKITLTATVFSICSQFSDPVLASEIAQKRLTDKGAKHSVVKTCKPVRSAVSQRGIASWYGEKFHGKKTASGQTYNMFALTAAHRTLPLLSYAKITNLKNHRSVVVCINDRGAFHGKKRDMDLSYAAAKKLGISGLGTVEITPITKAEASADQNHPINKPVKRG